MIKKFPLVKKIYEYMKEKYNTFPEFLWKKSPETSVFRCKHNRKWYSVILTVKKEKLGFKDEGITYILNVKIDDPVYLNFLLSKDGYFRAYHMNKNSWISILLDGTVPLKDIKSLIDLSYNVVSENKNRKIRKELKKEI